MSDDKSVTMTHHLGIDAGGTSTRAVVLDHHGWALGYGRSGSGNPISAGPEVAAASLRAATAQALAVAGVTGSAISTTAVAMAGGSSVSDDPAVTTSIRGALVPTGVTASVSIEKDLLALYFSGTPEPDGYALVSGTGAASVRVRGGEVEAVCDGLGWLLGDDGSGFWIGREVARAVAAALDGRGPATALTPLLIAASTPDGVGEIPSLPDGGGPQAPRRERDLLLREIVRRVYALRPVQLARYAPLAFEALAAHDAVAESIVRRAGQALAATLAAVAHPDLEGPLVVGGSVLVHQAVIRDLITGTGPHSVRGAAPTASRHGSVTVVPDGLVGAAVLALRNAELPVDRSVFEAITRSLAPWR